MDANFGFLKMGGKGLAIALMIVLVVFIILIWDRQAGPVRERGTAVAFGSFKNEKVLHIVGTNDAAPAGNAVVGAGDVTSTSPSFLDTPQVLNVVSTHVQDTAEGSGARTVRVTGLDYLWQEQSEVVTMNGTTNVPTTKQFLRVNLVEVLTAGVDGVNNGDITVTATPVNFLLATMPTGEGVSSRAFYSIPAGYKAVLKAATAQINYPDGAGAGDNNATVEIFKRNSSTTVQQLVDTLSANGTSSPTTRSFDAAPIFLPEKTDIWCESNAAVATGISITATMDLYIIKA